VEVQRREETTMTDELHVVVYPADRYGCGYMRTIWPSEALQRQGVDVTIVADRDRHVEMVIDDRNDTVVDVSIPEHANLVVLQRVTHQYLVQAVEIIRRKGVAVVIDVDDDLTSIHPNNPAWEMLHPQRSRRYVGKPHRHSWRHLGEACRAATLVVCTTPALARRYGANGNAVVIPNYLPEHYYDVNREDSDLLGWPASLHSHPNDPDVVGNAVARLVAAGHRFHVASHAAGVGAAFGLDGDDSVDRPDAVIDLPDWPNAIGKIGVGIAPLADTKFNAAKSWLKPLELAAVGVPWVGSPRDEYRRLHDLGCGVLADRPKDWYRVLRSLLTDERRRAELADAGRNVAAQLRLENHAWKWAEAWQDALTRERSRQRASTAG
jgi:hypothetical protein